MLGFIWDMIGLGAVGYIAYEAGQKKGAIQAVQMIEDQRRDAEIESLKRQLQEMKAHNEFILNNKELP